MGDRFVGPLLATAAVIAFVLTAPVALAAQAQAVTATTTWTAPRTPDGQPDIQGFWDEREGGIMGLYSIETGAQIEHHIVTRTTQRKGASMVIDPPDGRIPCRPWAAAIREEIRDNHLKATKPHHIDPVVRCFLEGTRNFYQSAFQILQSPGQVVILFEYQHASRVIRLGGPHIGGDIKLFMGDSVGRWEGNTLVVDVTNNNDQTWFDLIGSFHSDAMRITERYTFVNADTIRYEATIDDPQVFTRQWTLGINFDRLKEPGYELLEHACHEGERDAASITKNRY